MRIENVKKCSTSNYSGEFSELNSKGERITYLLTKTVPDNNSSNSLPRLWVKKGITKHLYKSYWNLYVFVHTPDGKCYDKYNPTYKSRKDGKGQELNFEWVLEATNENKEKLLDELERRAFGDTEEGEQDQLFNPWIFNANGKKIRR